MVCCRYASKTGLERLLNRAIRQMGKTAIKGLDLEAKASEAAQVTDTKISVTPASR